MNVPFAKRPFDRVSMLLLVFVTSTVAANDLDLPDVSLVAAATEAGMPEPSPGEVHEFTGSVATIPCSRWEVLESSDPALVESACGDYRMYFKREEQMNLHRVTTADGKELVRFDPAYPSLRFPLAVGKQWRKAYAGHSLLEDIAWQGDVSCEVADFAKVSVAAGDLDAFRIECKDRWKVADAESSVTSTTWYAPALEAVVKSVNYEDPRWNTELKRVSR
ncbi:MAG: hypothetical protein FJ164_04300 [Gammaproteobacteria bacterium]|nr:hypothetical protein [Gammaproteobacteria bacterium]